MAGERQHNSANDGWLSKKGLLWLGGALFAGTSAMVATQGASELATAHTITQRLNPAVESQAALLEYKDAKQQSGTTKIALGGVLGVIGVSLLKAAQKES